MKIIKKVNKEDYQVHQFIGGYYGICEMSSGGDCVYGGDSACEDHYNEDYINEVFQQWDGTLHYTGEKYGYKIEAEFKKYGTAADGPIFYIDEEKLNLDHIKQIRNYLNSKEKLLKKTHQYEKR